MDRLGDDEKKKIEHLEEKSELDLSDAETVPIDNERFSPQLRDEFGAGCEQGDDELQLADTLPVDDAFPFGDAFETQMVDFGGETQVMDFNGETQVVNLGGETQVLDDCDAEVPIDSDAEVPIDSDANGEGSDKTEVLCDNQELSDDDSVGKGGNCSADLEHTLNNGLSKESYGGSKAESGSLSSKGHHSGSTVRGFTSIRTASLRASGLAARDMAIKRINNSLSPTQCENCPEQLLPKKDRMFSSRDSPKLADELTQKYSLEDYDSRMKESGNENTCQLGSSAVRKLFMDTMVPEIRQPDDGMYDADSTAGVPQFAAEHGLAGLSYVDSQEPGDLSQVNALDVVDKFLELNAVEDDQDFAFTRSDNGKSKSVSSAKGTQSIAKKATVRSIDGESMIFNWDDDLEDEGGGEFFQKKKKLFFVNGGQQRSSSHSKKPPYLSSKSFLTIQQHRDKKEQVDRNRKLKDAVLSDSRLLSKNLRANESSKLRKASVTKNLLEELDEEMDAATGTGDKLVDAGTDKDLPDKMDVGFDTQMAADAMKTLQFAVSVTSNDRNNSDEGTKKLRKSSRKDNADDRSSLGRSITQKRACSSHAEVITRQSKKAKRIGVKSSRESSLSTLKQSKYVRKQSDAQLVKREPKRPKADYKDLITNGSENLSTVSKVIGQREKDRVPVASDLDQIAGAHVTALSGQKPLKRHSLQEELDCLTPIARRTRGAVKAGHSKGENNLNCSLVEDDAGECGDMNLEQNGQSNSKSIGGYNCVKTFASQYPRGRRTRLKLPLIGQEASTQYYTRSKRSKSDSANTSMDPIQQLKEQSSVCVGGKMNGSEEASPKDSIKKSPSASTTPVSCMTPINAASPICMGDEYHKQSRRKNLLRSSLIKEFNSITATAGAEFPSAMKELRKRKDMTDVRVLFSRHLDADIIKQQKKILARLGASVASSMSDATHFIADEFVRTSNMLEAIAFGKPVVTHSWLENCGQANCFIDERNHILRDARKEKELGFSMPVSLARACQHPLLQEQRVLITPKTKPGKEILASLVKAVHGLAVERLGRSALKDARLPDGILVLSCEEDYEICVPFLEKGAAVYSSELLLNGIVTQRLEYERHRLFIDNVKRTRSTIWLKKSNNQYLPVIKSK